MGLKKVTADKLPRFLYPDGHEYNAEDTESTETGLLPGHLLKRVSFYIHINSLLTYLRRRLPSIFSWDQVLL
jgi:hypothetical protein